MPWDGRDVRGRRAGARGVLHPRDLEVQVRPALHPFATIRTEGSGDHRQHLKRALELATKAQDNHLRALVLALVSAHYLHTAGDHARGMLQTCEQLAAGLGAPLKPVGAPSAPAVDGAKDAVGNAPLGLWVGERFLGGFPMLFAVYREISAIDSGGPQSCTSGMARMRERRSRWPRTRDLRALCRSLRRGV